MKPLAFLRRHRHLRRLLIGLGVTVALYTILGFFVVPPVARSVATKQLTKLLHRDVTIQKIAFNPYRLAVTIWGVRIRDRDGARDLLTLREVHANAEIMSLFKGVIVREARIVEPRLRLVRLADGRYNFSDILDELGAPASQPAPAAKPEKPARFSLNNLRLIDGGIELDDRQEQTRHSITGLDIGVPFLSNLPYLVETYVQPSFAATINGTPLALHGRTKPFSDTHESTIDLDLADVDLPYYLGYVPVPLKFTLRSGALRTKLTVSFAQPKDRAPTIGIRGLVDLSNVEAVDDKQGPLVALPKLEVAVDTKDVMSHRVEIERVLVDRLTLHAKRLKNGDMNLQHLVGAAPASAPAAAKAAPAAKAPASATTAAPAKAPASAPAKEPDWIISAGEIRLAAATIVFEDASNPKPFATTLKPLGVVVRGFSTARGHRASFTLDAQTEAKEVLAVAAKVALEPFALDGTITLKGLPLKKYSPYYAAPLLFDLEDGVLDAKVPVRLAAKGAVFEIAVTGLEATLENLRLRRRGERDDFVRVPRLALTGAALDLGARTLEVGSLTTEGGRVRLSRAGAGKPWNLATLVAPTPPAKGRAAAAPAPGAPAAPAAKAAAEKPWTATVRTFDLTGYAVRVDDRGQRRPAVLTLDRLGLHAEGLTTERGKHARLTLQGRLNEKGTINVGGSVGLEPLTASVKVGVKNLPLVPLQPYYEDMAGVLVTGGAVSVDGAVTFVMGLAGPEITYRGDVGLDGFGANDRSGVEELLRVGALRVTGIEAATAPLKVRVGEVGVRDLVAHVVVLPGGGLNLASIAADDKSAEKSARVDLGKLAKGGAAPPAPPPAAVAPGAKEAAGAPASPPLPVRIARVTFKNTAVTFNDRSITPAFSLGLDGLEGQVTGLALDDPQRAEVQLRGRVGGESPVEIVGQVSPAAASRSIDLTIRFRSVDLSAMTPYSGRFLGYAIEKGALTLDLRYQINQRKLEAKNTVRIDQLTFGQAIASKQATKLPVRLAVALLKDRHGVINLDLPVNGSLDNPKFKVWGVIWMVVNLLIKAATSPFALLGSLFGKGEELSYLEFEAGRAKIPAAGASKIATLTKALYDRPALRLEIEGHVDPPKDLEALRRLGLERKVKAQKLKETVRGAATDATLDEVTVAPAEYPIYLKRAYQSERIPGKPKTFFGAAKDVPAAEMERLLLAAVTVTNDDLRLLARQRAEAVRDALVRSRKVELNRVFLVEPKSLKPARRDKTADSRVDFRLQ